MRIPEVHEDSRRAEQMILIWKQMQGRLFVPSSYKNFLSSRNVYLHHLAATQVVLPV